MLVNTTLFDGEGEMPEGTAMAVKSDRIVAIGPFDSLKTLYSTAEIVDGEGAFVIPGLIDAHVHPVSGAEQIGFVQLSGLKSVQNIREAISAYASQKPELELIRGRGWELSVFENGNPSKELLDEIVPDRPAIMVSWDGHSSWVNSKALELAGVNANTPDPKNGRIERLPNGEPSGTLRESAMGLVSSLIPERSFEEHVELMRRGIHEMNAQGITGFIEASTSREALEVLKTLYADGELTARVVTSLGMGYSNPKSIKELNEMRNSVNISLVNTSSVKVFADGVPEARTAAMLEPYTGHPNDHGILNFNPDELSAYVDSLDSEGFQIHVHALGDAAIRNTLDAFGDTDTSNRHHISHLQIIHPDDFSRFADLGVAANFQPYWAQGDELNLHVIEPMIGEERSRHIYPIRSIMKTGAKIVAGSDWPVSTLDPYDAMQVSVTRKQIGVENDPAYKPWEAVTIREILTAYTKNNAWLMKLENITGRLKPGFSADFVLLDQNLLEIPPDSISYTRVLKTYFMGEKVYDLLEEDPNRE